MREIALVSVLISCASTLAGLFLPWWWMIVPIAMLAGFCLCSSAWKAFTCGAIGVGGLWFGWSLWIYLACGAGLANKIAQMLHIPFPWLLVAITSLIGALIAGVACSAGFDIRRTCENLLFKIRSKH